MRWRSRRRAPGYPSPARDRAPHSATWRATCRFGRARAAIRRARSRGEPTAIAAWMSWPDEARTRDCRPAARRRASRPLPPARRGGGSHEGVERAPILAKSAVGFDDVVLDADAFRTRTQDVEIPCAPGSQPCAHHLLEVRGCLAQALECSSAESIGLQATVGARDVSPQLERERFPIRLGDGHLDAGDLLGPASCARRTQVLREPDSGFVLLATHGCAALPGLVAQARGLEGSRLAEPGLRCLDLPIGGTEPGVVGEGANNAGIKRQRLCSSGADGEDQERQSSEDRSPRPRSLRVAEETVRLVQWGTPPLGEWNARPRMDRPRGPCGLAIEQRRMSVAEDRRSGGWERWARRGAARHGRGTREREQLGVTDRYDCRGCLRGFQARDRSPVTSRAPDLLAHGDIHAITAAIGRRADAGVLERPAGEGCVVRAAPLSHLEGDVPVRCDTEHGTAGPCRDTGQDRQGEVELDREVEAGAHELRNLVGCPAACQSRAPAELAGRLEVQWNAARSGRDFGHGDRVQACPLVPGSFRRRPKPSHQQLAKGLGDERHPR